MTQKNRDPLENAQIWARKAQKELKDKPLEDLTWTPIEGFPLDPLYAPKDGVGTEHPYPGLPPFTRGVHATQYTNKAWSVRQYAGFSTAEETNAFFKSCLAGGQTGLSVAFDLATHRGYDSDHPAVQGDVGKAGVAIDSVEDMKRLFDGIPLDKITVSMTMNGAVLPILAAFIVAAEEQGVEPALLQGTLQNDILKEFLVRNTYIYPPKESLRITGDILVFATENMPKFNPISISGYHMHEAGANAVQELAFTLADGVEYVKLALSRGLSVDQFAPRLSFFFAIGMNFFMEVAKLRAGRLLWSKLMSTFNPQDPRSQMLRVHCQTSGVSLQAQDPYTNIIRTTLEALAAVLGGTQSLHTNAFDEALALPTEFSARLARNTQLVLRDETQIPKVVDPLGGSYYVEHLTEQLATSAMELFDKIQAMGGMLKAIESGFAGSEIEKSATQKQAALDEGRDIVVGVNRYQANKDADQDLNLLVVDTVKVLEVQIKRLRELKKTRDQAAVDAALKKLRHMADTGTGNLLAGAIDAMRVRATLGEVSGVLADVFGRFEAVPNRLSGVYKSAFRDIFSLRIVEERMNAYTTRTQRNPKILILKMGQDGHDRGAKVLASALSDLGFEVVLSPLFQTPERAVDLVIEHDVDLVGISSHTAAHKSLLPLFMKELERRHKLSHPVYVVCGGVIPPQDIEFLKDYGVEAVFPPGTNIPEAALRLLNILERRNYDPGVGE